MLEKIITKSIGRLTVLSCDCELPCRRAEVPNCRIEPEAKSRTDPQPAPGGTNELVNRDTNLERPAAEGKAMRSCV